MMLITTTVGLMSYYGKDLEKISNATFAYKIFHHSKFTFRTSEFLKSWLYPYYLHSAKTFILQLVNVFIECEGGFGSFLLIVLVSAGI